MTHSSTSAGTKAGSLPAAGGEHEALVDALAEDLAHLHDVADELGRRLAALEADHALREATARG